MDKLSNLEINIEPVLKLQCWNTSCKFNLYEHVPHCGSCNLKHIQIGSDGICRNMNKET